MKLTHSLAIVSMLSLSLPGCLAGGPDDPNEGAVGTAEQNGAVGTAEQDGAVGTAEQDRAVGTAEQDRAVGTAEQDGAVGTAEQALTCTQLYIWKYTYSDGTGTYKWDVTYNTGNDKWYVDERRIGGGFYKQYVVSPFWDTYLCYESNHTQSIGLKYSGVTMSGTHTALSCTQEEIQMPDKQRLINYVSFDAPCVQ
ncbi:MAG: hypothetical protein U0359_20310 [Byssovorax sp.]